MTDKGSIDEFLAFSREYSDALEALETIEKRGEAIAGLGGGEDLRAFVERFAAMAAEAEARAAAAGLPEIATWFRELVARAETTKDRLGV